MNSIDCLVFIATSWVLYAEGLYATADTITDFPDPIQGALFIRSKRDDGRSMTFSGFYPYGGMSSFASSGDWGQWHKGRGNRRPAVPPEWNNNNPSQNEWNNNNPSQNEWNNSPPQGPPQTEEDSSPETTEPNLKEEAHNSHEVNKDEERPAVNKKPKKKPQHHKEKGSEEEEEEDAPVSHGNSGGNAAASFNAWFPIMLGMFPQEDNENGYKSSSRKTPPPTTIVANSVSHGPGGVASSHAVAYGGIPDQRYRYNH